jgi:hypothetical protein
MRRVTAILSAAAVVLMAAGVVAQAKPNFAGEWKMMVARGQGEPGVDLIITQSATAMTFEYRAGVKLTYKLDGSESKNMMAGRGGAAPTDGRRLCRRRNIGASAERRSPEDHQGGLPEIRTRLWRLGRFGRRIASKLRS